MDAVTIPYVYVILNCRNCPREILLWHLPIEQRQSYESPSDWTDKVRCPHCKEDSVYVAKDQRILELNEALAGNGSA